MLHHFFFYVLVLSTVLLPLSPAWPKGIVHVFILSGQSNMVGAGEVRSQLSHNDGKGSLEWLTENPATAPHYRHLRNDDGSWKQRDDVQICFFDRRGPLHPGYGSNANKIGPELGFGCSVGDAIKEPVLLIKIAWGGKSLAKDFRPPSLKGETGLNYTKILEHTQEVLRQADQLLPQLKGRTLSLKGFGWHQGWNDRINQSFNDAYTHNMIQFIKDIRRDLKTPALPFVLAETGMSGLEEKHPRALSLMAAQKATTDYPEFKGNVAFVPTRDFYRPADVSPSNQAYHWNNNAETYYLIGEHMGLAMLGLLKTH